MSNLAAVVVVALTMAISGALFFVGKVGNYEGNFGTAVSVILGIFVGLAAGLAFVTVWCRWVPLARRDHWRTGESPQGNERAFWAKSRHWHKALNMRLEIITPNGTQKTLSVFMSQKLISRQVSGLRHTRCLRRAARARALPT